MTTRSNSLRRTLLAVTAIACVGCGAATTAVQRSVGPGHTERITLSDYHIAGLPASLASGPEAFDVTNKGETLHNFTVERNGQLTARTHDLAPGQRAQLEITLQPGTYTYLCTVPGHAALGMEGTFDVS